MSDYGMDEALEYLCARFNLDRDTLGYGSDSDSRALATIVAHIERLNAEREWLAGEYAELVQMMVERLGDEAPAELVAVTQASMLAAAEEAVKG